MRTFHIGGTASRIAAQSEVVAKNAGKMTFKRIQTVVGRDGSPVMIGRNGEIQLVDPEDRMARSPGG